MRSERAQHWLRPVVLVALFLLAGGAFPEEPETDAGAETQVTPAYTSKGADTCLKCHDEDSAFPVLSIFKTRHAQRSDPRTPFASLQCEACHGPGGEHARKVRPGEDRAHIRDFGRGAKSTVEEQNGACLNCHEAATRTHWQSSAHARADVPCAGCHAVHATHDRVLTRAGQPEACFDCHTQQRMESHLAFTHPLRHGQMACTDCHAVHGSMQDALLIRPTTNETCFECHADKRGPFLWEHAPVTEDCTLCHRPHGSNHPALLTQRVPLLCQQCHSQAGHPSLPFTPAGLPPGMPSGFLLANSCTNCHSQVHGSNHPSGVKLMR
jgi:DmsE family decaheme c-type cytochrome